MESSEICVFRSTSVSSIRRMIAPTLVASIEPIENKGSSAAYMKVTGRGRRKTHACHVKAMEYLNGIELPNLGPECASLLQILRKFAQIAGIHIRYCPVSHVRVGPVHYAIAPDRECARSGI